MAFTCHCWWKTSGWWKKSMTWFIINQRRRYFLQRIKSNCSPLFCNKIHINDLIFKLYTESSTLPCYISWRADKRIRNGSIKSLICVTWARRHLASSGIGIRVIENEGSKQNIPQYWVHKLWRQTNCWCHKSKL